MPRQQQPKEKPFWKRHLALTAIFVVAVVIITVVAPPVGLAIIAGTIGVASYLSDADMLPGNTEEEKGKEKKQEGPKRQSKEGPSKEQSKGQSKDQSAGFQQQPAASNMNTAAAKNRAQHGAQTNQKQGPQSPESDAEPPTFGGGGR